MIKKYIYKLRYLLIILTAVLGLLGLSSSFGAYEVGLPYYAGSYSTTIQSYGKLSTSWTGGAKKLFAIDSKNFFFWNGTGLYEMFYSDRLGLEHWEGYLPYFFLCSNNFGSSATSWHDVGMCDQYSINSNFDILSAYMGGVNSDNYFIFGNDFNGASPSAPYFCVNTDLDKSICFDGWNRNLQDESGWPTNDLNLGDITIYDIDSSYLKDSPFIPGGAIFDPISGGGTNWGGVSVGDITNDMVIDNYQDMGWNKAICYNGIISGSNSNLLSGVVGSGSNIFEVYENNNPLGFADIITWYDYYRNGFNEYRNVGPNSVFWWDGAFHMGIYNIFAYGAKYGVSNLFPSSDIIEYCSLFIARESDPSFGGAVYTGELESWERTTIYNTYYNQVYYSGAFNLDLTGAIDSLSGEDFTGGFLDMLGELSRRFNNGLGQLGGNVVGIIPSYITAFLFALILIRILRK